MKYRVTWWIHASGKLNGGSDVIEASVDFDEDAAEGLIEEDLSRNLRDPSSLTADKYDFPSPFEPNLPKFLKKHRDLSNAARHSEISNWGVRFVKPLKETTIE